MRLVRFLNKSTDTVQAQFSEPLDPGISIANVAIVSAIGGFADLTIRSVQIDNDVVTIVSSPQFPLVLYTLKFISTEQQLFASVNGDLLDDDTISASVQFVGLESPKQIRDGILGAVPPTYNVDSDTLVRKHLSNISQQLFRAKNDIRDVGSSNYISVDVIDEVKTRGFGPTDRLNNEGAYEVVRVGLQPTGASESRVFDFAESQLESVLPDLPERANTQLAAFPSDPLSLRSVTVEEEVSNREDDSNGFAGLVLTLSNKNIIRLNACTLQVENGDVVVYDIPEYGYALANNRYDTRHAHELTNLETNQIKLSDASVLNGAFQSPGSNDSFVVSYTYENKGIDVDEESIQIAQVRSKVRENVGAFLTTISLSGFPITNSNGDEITEGGVEFLDPLPDDGEPFSETHRAFLEEIPFDETALPSVPGQYAVDYETGQVFVYGVSENDGTGTRPPVASYSYLKVFQNNLDYNFDPDTDEVSANSSRELAGSEVFVKFDFEQALVPGVDFEAKCHVEVIDEEVENRLAGAFRIWTKQVPITNVFRILNRTTGEVYVPTNFSDSIITFSGRAAPKVLSKTNEPANFTRVSGEELAPSEVVSSNSSEKIVKFNLQNPNLIAASNDSRGSSANTGATFSSTSIFVAEFFYDDELMTVSENLDKISDIGDYLVDYKNGLIYLRCSATTDEFGHINYLCAKVDTIGANVLSVDGIEYKQNNKSSRLLELQTDGFTAQSIVIDSLPQSPERFLNSNTDQPIVLGAKQYGVAGQRTVNSTIFVALDAIFEEGHADGNHIIRFSDDSDRQVVGFISDTAVEVDVPFTDSEKSVDWCLIDSNFSDGYTAATTFDIVQVRGVYTVADLQSSDSGALVNLFNPLTDTIDGNVITFNSEAIKSVEAGAALAVDYNFGNIYCNYTHVADNLTVSYEYGDNSLDFSGGTAVSAGKQYYCSYKFGAMREGLGLNFGSLTQLPELTSFPLSTNREIYRDAVAGALQAFVNGPTVNSIKTAVSSITKVDPDITELSFNEWTAGRDYLHLEPPKLTGEEKYGDGKFESGIIIDGTTTIELPSDARISYKEGTFECWARPYWRGIDNDAILTFDIGQDGVSVDAYDGYGVQDGYRIALQDIYIGSSAFNPTAVPFSLHRSDAPPASPTGRPRNFGDVPGYFIWYDEDVNEWMVRMVADPTRPLRFTGEITTTGQFRNVRDGYEAASAITVNEGLDRITSTYDSVQFSVIIDGYEAGAPDGYVGFDGYGQGVDYVPGDGYLYQDGVNFTSDDIHYAMDTGETDTANRISLFKDGLGYFNLQIYDKSGAVGNSVRVFNISSDVSDWLADDLHHIAASWRFNSADGADEAHLFIDGQEVANNFKYGGGPAASSENLFRSEAREYITESAPKTIVSGADGVSIAGSQIFTSAAATFISDGIQAGDSFNILDNTADGLGGPYTVASVDSQTQITLTAALLLSLSEVSYSCNQLAAITETALDAETIAVFVEDEDGEVVELRGLEADSPQYSIEKSGSDDRIRINDGVAVGDAVFINTLGLRRGRVRDTVYDFSEDQYLRTNLPPPFALEDVKIYKIIGRRAPIIEGGQFNPGDGYGDGQWSLAATQLSGTFTNLSQPSNTVVGKKLKLTLGGSGNIDFTGTNQVLVSGSSSSGPTSELITFSDYGANTTTTLWTVLDSFTCTFTGHNVSRSFGSLEIMELLPITVSEGGGNYASVARYSNGEFELHTFGSGGSPFTLHAAYYLLDYPVKLSIGMSGKGPLMIGSDRNGERQFDGVLDEICILNEMLDDVRAGESKTERTVTEDYSRNLPLEPTTQTTLLMHCDKNLETEEKRWVGYGDNVLISGSSVNSRFGNSAVFLGTAAQVEDNGDVLIDNNHGTIEFWVSPVIDTFHDDDIPRYYVDACAASEEFLVSETRTRVVLSRKARKIVSVRLATDDGTGTDFFEGGNLSIDGTTIELVLPLPNRSTRLKVAYISADNSGNRISIYKDGYGELNFELLSNTDVFKISQPISWARNTWHRVMATWDLNNIDNRDRIRLFVDGVQGGTVMYGSPGFLYGIGILYGQSLAGTQDADLLTTNIDMTDTFPQVTIGNQFSIGHACMARIDNIRFSSVVREPSQAAGVPVDLNYNANLESVWPVQEDNETTGIFDYEEEAAETEFLSNLYDEATPLFSFDVDVIDSFDIINGNEQTQELIRAILGRLKPAHTKANVRFES